MTITQAEIDDLRRKADEALEVEEEWGPLIRGRCCDDCDIRYAFQDAANPERITRLLDAHKAQAERIETLEGALLEYMITRVAPGAVARATERFHRNKGRWSSHGDEEAVMAWEARKAAANKAARAALGETEEG